MKISNPYETDTVDLDGVQFTHKDILNVVDDFYTRVQNDEVLQVPFASVRDWPEHIHKLTHFWWVRFGGKAYLSIQYNPIAKHLAAGFNRDFLVRWLGLFRETMQTHLQPAQVDAWRSLSELMGESLSQRNEFLKAQQERRL